VLTERPKTTDTVKIRPGGFLGSSDPPVETVLALPMTFWGMTKAMVFRKKSLNFHCRPKGSKGDPGLERSASSFHAGVGDSHTRIETPGRQMTRCEAGSDERWGLAYLPGVRSWPWMDQS
jgi:hypothetical protein